VGNGGDIRQFDDDEILGELRRRNVDREYASAPSGVVDQAPRQRLGERQLALLITGILTAMLVAVISWLAIDGSEIPDLLAGLTGSGFGGIVGILAGSATQPTRG
jgi:hypothetical protein